MREFLLSSAWWAALFTIIAPLSWPRLIGAAVMIYAMMLWQLWDGITKGADYMLEELSKKLDKQ